MNNPIDYVAKLAQMDKEREEIAKMASLQKEVQEVGARQNAEQAAMVEKYQKELSELAVKHGYKSFDELSAKLYPKALKKTPKNKKAGKVEVAAPNKKRKKRAKITPEMKHEMRNAKTKGVETAKEIADRFGVSIGYVNKLKRTDE